MYKMLRKYISVLLFAILILSGCNPLPNPFASNPFVSSAEIDQVIKSGSFVEDTELQYFPIFNCQSQVQNTVNVSRSRTLEQSVHISIDPNIKFASSDKLSSFINQVDVTIGGDYGWTNGTTIIDSYLKCIFNSCKQKKKYSLKLSLKLSQLGLGFNDTK